VREKTTKEQFKGTGARLFGPACALLDCDVEFVRGQANARRLCAARRCAADKTADFGAA
jgi:hypothetical protein